MDQTNQQLKELEQKAAALLEQCEVVTIASITAEGYPRPVPMSKIKTNGINEIWLATGTTSDKTIHFRKNPLAGISFMQGGDSVCLTGKVSILEDLETKKALWQDWFISHFPGGVEDPNYCILKFTAEEAIYWIEYVFIKAKIDK